MGDSALQFSDNERIGTVLAVDSDRVVVAVDNSPLLTRVAIGNLVAIRGVTEHEFLIGMVERVTRALGDMLVPAGLGGDHADELAIQSAPTDQMRAFLVGTFRSVDGDRRNTFKRGADTFPQIERECFYVDGANLQRFMGLLGADVPEGARLKLGTFVADRTADAIASGDRFFQRHAAVLGSTGSGKSWAVALLLERAAQLAHPNIVLFDMHGEYTPLCAGDGIATRFHVAGPGDLDDPPHSALFLPYWLLNRDEMLSMLLDRTDQNAPNQASRFTQHVRYLKDRTLERAGQVAVRRTFTVDSPVPYAITDLVNLLEKDNTGKNIGAKGQEVKGDWEGKLTRFLARLTAKLEDRRYGFMFGPPAAALDYGWLAQQVGLLLRSDDGNRGIKVVDFSEVPVDVLPVVTAVLARLLYDVQFWMAPERRTPVSIICDEAHLYLPTRDDADATQKQALAAFERIAKEGRKYGFSIVVVSQRPSDVSRTILSQCNNFLALRLTNEADQGVIKRLMPESLVGLTATLPLLDTGEGLMLGDAILLPSRIRLDKPERCPASATRDFWREWGTSAPDPEAISAAVQSLRKQARG